MCKEIASELRREEKTSRAVCKPLRIRGNSEGFAVDSRDISQYQQNS